MKPKYGFLLLGAVFFITIGIITFSRLTSSEEESDTLAQGVGIPILLYHALSSEASSSPSNLYLVSKDVFKKQLSALKEAGYISIGTQELYDYYYNNGVLPKKAFMITFDDGRKDSYEYSDEILQELGFKAVMCIIPLMQEKKYPLYLTWHTLNKMQRSDHWDIQAHGYLYHNLIPIDEKGTLGDFASNLMWLKKEERLENFDEYKQRLHDDLILQKEIIRKHIPDAKVLAFAFPFGDWGVASQNMDTKLSIAINYAEVNDVFPLSFGDVTFTLEDYVRTTTPHLITRFMCTQTLDIEKVIRHFEESN
jgi:peptidoglycan/xylan/chitin deacetylase (PgdA/CDA1 family)